MESAVAGGPAPEIFCPECDYNLHGLTSERCPECGLLLAFLRESTSQIPWTHRDESGIVRSYGRTVFWVMFRRKRLAVEIARPADYADSQKFRWLTIAIASIAFLAATALFLWFESETGGLTLLHSDGSFTEGVWIAGFYCLDVPLLFVCLTGLTSYFFHPKRLSIELQNRAVALSYYTAAPLALMPLAPIFFAASRIMLRASASHSWVEPIETLFLGTAMLWPFALLTKWWLDLVFLARRALHFQGRSLLRFYLWLPLLWLLTAVAILFVLPAIILYVAAFFVSLYG